MAWWEFHPRADAEWPGARECHSMCVWGDKLVLFGGNNQTARMNDVHLLDTGE